MATNFYYLTPIDMAADGTAGPDGRYQTIAMNDSLTNLIGIGSFLVSEVPKRLVSFESECYAPEERTSRDSGDSSYDINARLLRNASLTTVKEKTYYAFSGGREYIIPFYFRRVVLKYIVTGTKEFRIITEKGLRVKTYKLVRIVHVEHSSW